MDKWYHAHCYEHVSITTMLCASKMAFEHVSITTDAYANQNVTIVNKGNVESLVVDIDAAQSSVITVFIVHVGMQDFDCRVTTNCLGSGARIEVKIIYILNQNQVMRLATHQSHAVPSSESLIISKGVLYDAARMDCTGLIMIEDGGSHTNAQLFNKNLLLSDAVRVTAQPQLEVKTNDVSCAHGTASGYPDAYDLYFMQSRGLSFECARTLIVEGFMVELIDVTSESQVCNIWQECKSKLL